MTPAQKAGFNVGDKAIVIEAYNGFRVGEKLELIKDDGSHVPRWECINRAAEGYLRLIAVEPLRAHPSAQILREIADEAEVNPKPHLAFEQRCLDGLHTAWRTPNHLQVLLYSACRDVWQVRRKPKTVRAEGEVAQEVIDRAEHIIGRQGSGDDATVAHALLSLVKDE